MGKSILNMWYQSGLLLISRIVQGYKIRFSDIRVFFQANPNSENEEVMTRSDQAAWYGFGNGSSRLTTIMSRLTRRHVLVSTVAFKGNDYVAALMMFTLSTSLLKRLLMLVWYWLWDDDDSGSDHDLVLSRSLLQRRLELSWFNTVCLEC
ncbi:hypothetical protein Tco_0414648 [Tanacetum coccineum]